MREKVYEWQSTGNDSLCDALSGYHYGSEPSRPHPNCNCTIVLVEGGPETSNRVNVWEEGHDYKKSGPGELQYDFEITFGYQVRCPDGSGQSGTVVVTRDYELIYQQEPDGDTSGFWAEILYDALLEARTNVEAIADSICPAPLIV